MAVQARLTGRPLPPFSATEDERNAVENEAEQRGISIGTVLRECVDNRFGLINGKRPKVE